MRKKEKKYKNTTHFTTREDEITYLNIQKKERYREIVYLESDVEKINLILMNKQPFNPFF
jgi:hypothetical protein